MFRLGSKTKAFVLLMLAGAATGASYKLLWVRGDLRERTSVEHQRKQIDRFWWPFTLGSHVAM